MSLPTEIVDKITRDAVVLSMYDLGWQPVHDMIKKCLFVKRTGNIFSPEIRFERAQRVDSFYCEKKPIYTWTRPHERLSNLYVYGNPFEGYSF